MTESQASDDAKDAIDDPSEGAPDSADVDESTTSTPADDDEGQPDLDDEEMADLDAIADDIQDDADVESEDADDPEDDNAESATSAEESSTTSSERSWGRMYRKGVVKTSEALVDEFGDQEAEPITEADVQDFELDEAFDEFMAEKTGRPEDIPPGQWVALGTIVLVGGNLATETDVAGELLEGASDGI